MGIETLIGAAVSIASSVGGALLTSALAPKPKIQAVPPIPVLAPTGADSGDLASQAQALRLKRGRASTILAGGDTTGVGGAPAKGGLKTVLGG